ncbi:hypothetical protein COO60DRAFT_1463114 [Scenedesmus sp. NREL 46B-D3]|nr:hypothetical protein COO60DRAFT_1463114 [Scenedesmus sp. NREL 46B-D3]
METKQAQLTAKTLALCAKAQLTQDDIWFIRDRLHERCPFFRLWPPQLQQLICRLARPMHWVQHEVLASQGGAACKDLCLILEGQARAPVMAAVAVRSAPGISTLKDVASLTGGDTFGELALLGVQHSPAFIVVRSQQLLAVAVSAQQLAHAMLKLPLNSKSFARMLGKKQILRRWRIGSQLMAPSSAAAVQAAAVLPVQSAAASWAALLILQA